MRLKNLWMVFAFWQGWEISGSSDHSDIKPVASETKNGPNLGQLQWIQLEMTKRKHVFWTIELLTTTDIQNSANNMILLLTWSFKKFFRIYLTFFLLWKLSGILVSNENSYIDSKFSLTNVPTETYKTQKAMLSDSLSRFERFHFLRLLRIHYFYEKCFNSINRRNFEKNE